MKFIHAADIHLDSPLSGLSRYEGAPVESIRGATRRALDNLVQLCLDENADLLLLAGDLYDGDWRDYNTGLYFVSRMARLTREGIQVVLVRGNHDAQSQITSHLPLPEGVTELSTRHPETCVLESLGVAVHGQGYRRANITDDLTLAYPEPLDGFLNLGLLHTCLDGRPGHAAYAPCSLERLLNQGYGYWALGHVHAREVLHKDPWVVFPGNLQGRHARETGPKGASLVSVEDGVIVAVEHRSLDTVRWERCRLDAAHADAGHTLVEQATAELEHMAQAADGRLLAARLEITGRSKAHAELCRDPTGWTERLRAAVAPLGDSVWLEKIRLDTRSPVDLDTLADRDDPLGELTRALGRLSDDPAVLTELLAEFDALKAKLPADYRRLDDALDLDDPAALGDLLRDLEHTLIPRLLDAAEP